VRASWLYHKIHHPVRRTHDWELQKAFSPLRFFINGQSLKKTVEIGLFFLVVPGHGCGLSGG
jgi:hypothetical protein